MPRTCPPRCVAVLFFAGAALLPLCDPFLARASSPSRVTKGPYLTGLTDTQVEVRFEMDSPGRAAVQVVREGDGTPPAAPEPGRNPTDAPSRRLVDDHKTDSFHVLSVGGLQPATRYEYTVLSGNLALATGRFATAPRMDSGATVKFLVYGDDRTDPSAHQLVVRALSSTPSDLLVNTGDLVEDGASADDWQSFFDAEKPLLRDRALLVSIGNHELYDDAAGANFARFFGFATGTPMPQPYGSGRIGAVRFFFLNGMHDWESGEERQWLERELGAADNEPGLRWRIVVVHHGPWSAGPHGGNAKLTEARVPELLAAHKVDLVLSGHDHIYERGDAGLLKYVVSGGGGAPLYRIAQATPTTRKAEASYHFVEFTADADALRLVAHRLDGSVIERCGLLKDRPWDCDPFPWVRPTPATLPSGSPATQGRASESVSPAAAPPDAPPSSRCGCSVPGDTRSGRSGPAWAIALGLALLAGRRRRARSPGLIVQAQAR